MTQIRTAEASDAGAIPGTGRVTELLRQVEALTTRLAELERRLTEPEAPVATSTGERNRLEIRMLGAFRVTYGNIMIGDWRQRRSRLLLMILADRSPCGVHRDELIEAIWPNREPAHARNNLNQAIHIVRRRFKDVGVPDPIEHVGERYRLRSDWNVDIDAHRFEELAEAALRHGDEDAADRAIELYRGDYLADEPYEEWVQQGRHHLKRLHLDVLEQRGRRLLDAGRLSEAVNDCRSIIRIDPTNEAAHRRLMAALVRQGRPTEALQAYERCRKTLADEIGIAPSAETDALYEEILFGETECLPEYSLSA